MLDKSGASLHVNNTSPSCSRNQIGNSLTVPKLDGIRANTSDEFLGGRGEKPKFSDDENKQQQQQQHQFQEHTSNLRII